MANTYNTYTDSQIMQALLTRDFSTIGGVFEDDEISKIKIGAFYQAQNLTSVSLSVVTYVDAKAFMEAGLSSLSLDWEKLTYIGMNAFTDLGGDVLPEVLALTRATTIQQGAFAQTSSSFPNTKLKTVSAPVWTGENSANSLFNTETRRGIFMYCSALTSVSAPLLTTVPKQLFERCNALVDVSFPSAVSCEAEAFSRCTALSRVRLGGAIQAMTLAPFLACTALTALILPGVTTPPTIGSSTFSGTRFATGAAYFYVPSSLVATFKVTSNWATYADQIRAIEDYPDVCNF